MQIKRLIIDNIHYINFITFDISTLFLLSICPAEIEVCLIQPCVVYAFNTIYDINYSYQL